MHAFDFANARQEYQDSTTNARNVFVLWMTPEAIDFTFAIESRNQSSNCFILELVDLGIAIMRGVRNCRKKLKTIGLCLMINSKM